MSISFSCTQCASKFNVDPKMAGKRAKCKCGNVIVVPAAVAPTPAAAPASSGMVVKCPSCQQQHQASAAMAGTLARCGCGAVLQIPGVPTTPAPPSVPNPPLDDLFGGAQPAHQQPAPMQQPFPAAMNDPFAQPMGQPSPLAPPPMSQPNDPFAQPMGGHPMPQQPAPQQQIGQPYGQQPASQESILDDLAAGEMAAQSVYQPFQPSPVQPAPVKSQQQSEDELLGQYIQDESWKEPDVYSDDGGGSFEEGMANSGMIGGMLFFVGGIVVFGGLMANGIIWPYALIISVLGLMSMGRSLFD